MKFVFLALWLSSFAMAADCDPKCVKLASEVEVLAPALETKDGGLKVARKLRDVHGCSTQFHPTWQRLLNGVPKMGLSDGEKKELRGCLMTFLRKNLDTAATLPEVMGGLDLAQNAVDGKLVSEGEKLQSLRVRGLALREEIEKAQPQMSTETSPVLESEKCTIGNPKADEQRKTDPLRKELLAWVKTAK